MYSAFTFDVTKSYVTVVSKKEVCNGYITLETRAVM